VAPPAAALAALALAAPPCPAQPIPARPARLAPVLAATSVALAAEVDRWRAAGGPVPRAVTLEALYQQRIYRLLSADPRLAATTIPRLPPAVRAHARDSVLAHRELAAITPPLPAGRRIRTGPPAPAAELLRAYREAERRFHVAWNVLAAVNFVESAFGKLRSASAAGAQGPMQFLPAAWRAYGLGGDVHDPHDAILGAANYLRAGGAPTSYRRALYRYNPHPAYVDAVLRYARRIGRDPRAFYGYYAWQVYAKTPSGPRRLTGPRGC
jgi:membrane-bound lytic murein transglycosylase B